MRALLLAVALGVLAGAAPAADRTFPGKNGLIVFASERGGAASAIYTMHTDGTRLARLTGGGAQRGITPAYSRDGRRIAFTRIAADGYSTELWVANADGTGARPVLRDVRIDVATANGLEPAWAPDGRHLAYVDYGAPARIDLWLVGLDGRGRRRLEYGAFEPAWSPDGRRLAFSRGRWIWIAEADGTHAHKLARGSSPSWSPDGRRLALVDSICDDCNAHVYLVGVDGRHRTRLTGGGRLDLWPAWSPDGRWIAFSTCCYDLPNGDSVSAIDVVSPSGTRRSIYRATRELGSLSWSRDGRRIAFGADEALFVVDLHGGRARPFFRGAVGGEFGPVWTPDGRRILFTRSGDGVYAMDGHGRGLHRVLPHEAIGSLAPDGRRYAIENDADGIDIVTLATGKIASYAALEDMGAGDTSKWDPAWSPKGGALAYLDGVPGDVGEVMLITIANGHARSLDVSAEGGLAWTPDGRALAFESGRSLYAFDVATHRRRLLARNAAQPAWSPDGRRIAFVRSFGRNREICVMRADGSAQRRLTHNPGADESPDWQPLR